jgi:hypothetical protein
MELHPVYCNLTCLHRGIPIPESGSDASRADRGTDSGIVGQLARAYSSRHASGRRGPSADAIAIATTVVDAITVARGHATTGWAGVRCDASR